MLFEHWLVLIKKEKYFYEQKIISLILAALLAVSALAVLPASAETNPLIWAETFDKATGTLSVGTVQDNLKTDDFANWYRQDNTFLTADTEMQVVEENLVYRGFCNKPAGKAVKITKKGFAEYRQFADINTGSVYLSALIKINSLPTTTSDVALSFAYYNGISFKQFGKLFAKVTEAAFQLGVAKNSESVNYLNYTGELTVDQTIIADVNGDESIDASDALLVLKFAVKKIDKFPVEEN